MMMPSIGDPGRPQVLLLFPSSSRSRTRAQSSFNCGSSHRFPLGHLEIFVSPFFNTCSRALEGFDGRKICVYVLAEHHLSCLRIKGDEGTLDVPLRTAHKYQTSTSNKPFANHVPGGYISWHPRASGQGRQ